MHMVLNSDLDLVSFSLSLRGVFKRKPSICVIKRYLTTPLRLLLLTMSTVATITACSEQQNLRQDKRLEMRRAKKRLGKWKITA